MTEQESQILQKLKRNEPLLDWYKAGEDGSNIFIALDVDLEAEEPMRARVVRVTSHRGSGR
jgi:hypothetical protein